MKSGVIQTVSVRARGLGFDVRVGGPDGVRAVLLLHGFPQRALMWDGLAERLQGAGLRTIAPDQRGYSPGARPPEPPAYSVAEAAIDALALLEELGAHHSPVNVVGHDFGAMVGWYLAGFHPDHVRTLTALSVPHPGAIALATASDAEQRRKYGRVLALRRKGVAEAELLADHGAALREMFAGSGMSPEEVDAHVAPLLADQALTPALNWYRAMDNRTVPRAHCPTTYIWGAEDPTVSRSAAHECASFVADEFDYLELPGVGHWLVEQALDTVTRAVFDRIGVRPA